MILAFLIAATVPTGVTPNDGNDDAAGFRSALATACGAGGDHVLDLTQLAAGTYDFTQESGKLGSLNVSGCAGLTVRGLGAQTRLRMIAKYMASGSDWYLFNVDSSSSDIEFADLTLDGSRAGFEALGALAEQVHLIRINGASRVSVRNVSFEHGFGDGIKALSLDDLSVADSRFRDLARGGIVGHSGVTDARIVGCSFDSIVDQHIQTEGAGGDARWTIAGNNFGASTGLVMDLGSSSGSGAVDITVTGNTFDDGRIQMYGLERFTFSGNTITASTGTALYLKGKVRDGVIANNSILSSASAYAVNVEALDTTRDPTRLLFSGNVIRHSGSVGLRVISGLGAIAVSGNHIEDTSTSTTSTGIQIGNTIAANQRGIVLAGNNVINQGAYGINVSVGNNASSSQDDITINGNVVVSTKSGAKGVYNWTNNAAGIPYPTKCRGDGNVLDVAGTKWTTVGATSPAPTSAQGCREHGDSVP
ncbi:MAG: right-handed parallel beta-helix repeat-containing protein [Alphaproteobacteria bacterium]